MFQLVLHLNEKLSQLKHWSTEMVPLQMLRLAEVSDLMNRLAEFVSESRDRLSEQLYQLENVVVFQLVLQWELSHLEHRFGELLELMHRLTDEKTRLVHSLSEQLY